VILYVQTDIEMLEQYRPELQTEPKLMSLYSLRAFRAMLTPKSLFWLATRDNFQFLDEDIIDIIGSVFAVEDPTNIQKLQRFSDLLFANAQYSSSIRYGLEYITGIIRALVGVANRQIDQSQTEYSEELDDAHLLVRQRAVAYFLTTDKNLRAMVDRQAPALSREFSDNVLKEMTGLATVLGEHNPTLVRKLTESFMSPPADSFDSEEAPQYVRQAWKFSIYKKFIVSGRMEVRSMGVSGLSDQLVAVHKEYNNVSRPQVPQYLASLIVDSKLVEYIVGPGSHPELMPMSANIVGFLVVTGRYTKLETDVIWERVITSQDPRIVAAIVEMVQGISHLMSYETLLYICEKLEKVPLNNFDGILQDFSRDVLEKTRVKFRDLPEVSDLDAPPYRLCIRLIREAAAGMASQAEKRAIYDLAMRELKQLMHWGPAESVRIMIFRDCIRDIQERTSGATGSISAISVLIGDHLVQNDELIVLGENNTIELIIDEFATTVENEKSLPWPGPEANSKINIRLQLLGNLLARLPDAIPPTLGRKLWNHLVGKDAYSMQERELAWNILCDVIRHTGTANSFIEECIKTYLDELEPEYYNPGVLSFVQQIVEHLGRLNYTSTPAAYQIIEIPGSEHAWNIFFKSPSQMAEIGVTQYLVQLYIDVKLIREAPRSAVEATHVALVNRCVSQLKTAAEKLPAPDDATEDKMQVRDEIQAGDERSAEGLQFSRSLLFLREFLRTLKARPLYSPLLPRPILPPYVPTTLEGPVMAVRFQVFGASHTTEIREFFISEEATLNELRLMISVVSGLSSFSAIIAGRMVDLESSPTESVKSIGLEQSPWVIVRQNHSAEEIVGDETLEGLSASELELMKHFNNLYEFLSLDENLASEV
jgi:ubiquitin carboxyl-terminal hydrolase 34